MRKVPVLILAITLLSVSIALAAIKDCDGIPIGNFSIGANITAEGRLFGQLIYNPSRLGTQLEPAGHAQFRFNMGDVTLHDTDFEHKQVHRHWPFAEVTLSDKRIPNVSFAFRTFAPLIKNDLFATSLPAIMAEVAIENTGDQPCTVNLAMVTDELLQDPKVYIATPSVHGIRGRIDFSGWAMPSAGWGKDNMGWAKADLPAKSKTTLRFIYARFDDEGLAASRFSDAVQIAEYAAKEWTSLLSGTEQLDKAIPSTGDAKVDEYARWYLACGPLMTKSRKDGIVVNMGYSELNQRDSFWTSWIHLAFWPEADRKMIEQSAEFQREDGKIPTTVLPLIERNDDIDITTFYIHRINRYSRYCNDLEFAKKMFPSLLRAFDFLYSLDKDGIGVPQQHSFWGDWKDVGGMENRKYSPYSTMLFAAALRDSAALAEMIGEKTAAKDLQQKYKAAVAFLNTPADKGGMFNGRFYRQLWKDPANNDERIMQDQVVGIVFDVVSPATADVILKSLQANMTLYGPAETFPYFPKEFGYEPGDYHNGGAWPYMTFVHAWALLKRSQTEEAYDIIKKMGYSDLEREGDWLPHEYVHTLTGAQGGPKIQGWNASIFAPLYFHIAGHSLDQTRPHKRN